jgi:hypothetical protein
MRGDRSTDIWAGAMDDVKDPTRQTGFAHDLAKHVSRHWRQLARFGDRGVPDGDGGRDLPAK